MNQTNESVSFPGLSRIFFVLEFTGLPSQHSTRTNVIRALPAGLGLPSSGFVISQLIAAALISFPPEAVDAFLIVNAIDRQAVMRSAMSLPSDDKIPAKGSDRILKHDAGLGRSLAAAGELAAQAEAGGYAGVWSSESVHDPFLPLVRAAEHTRHVDLGTSIAVALTRNPVVLASTARDLQDFSGGRFILGLGTQTRAHITRRFGLEWSRPAARIREFVRALHAIWDCWNGDGELNFEGEFYRHTLMTPAFNPGPSEFAKPRVFLAAVGVGMARVAGEVADGLLCHSFLTPEYFHDILLNAVDAGLARAGRTAGDLEIGLHPQIVPLTNDTDPEKQLESARYEIAFHASTPAYRPVLEHHGWGHLQSELNALTKAGRWDELAALIDDEVLRTFAIIAPVDQVEEEVRSRYGDRVRRLSWRFASDATTTRR